MYACVPSSMPGAHGDQKRALHSPGPGDMGGCEPPCESWEQSPDPLQEQQMQMPLTTEPGLLN